MHPIVEVKGYRREDAVVKKMTMETWWVPGVNHAGKYGRWAFAEFTDVYEMQDDFAAKVQKAFDEMIEQIVGTNELAILSAQISNEALAKLPQFVPEFHAIAARCGVFCISARRCLHKTRPIAVAHGIFIVARARRRRERLESSGFDDGWRAQRLR
ncbi:MAG: hypothetical protein LBQ20_00210 [Rhodanobacter sp.]|nr:hypothetical protein [Rhodanobacter sp.]